MLLGLTLCSDYADVGKRRELISFGETMLRRAFVAGAVSQFKDIVQQRLRRAAADAGRDDVTLPVALLLLIDKENGGDATADELARRFRLLDSESRDIIDFHFAGWRPAANGQSIEFSFPAFAEFRQALRRAGVRRFGGNADLILVDAVGGKSDVSLAFDEAIHINLSEAVRRTGFPSLGGFLQTLIDVAEDIGSAVGAADSPVFSISDSLGVTIGGRSALQYIFDKWGAIVGAGALSEVAVRRAGRRIPLDLL